MKLLTFIMHCLPHSWSIALLGSIFCKNIRLKILVKAMEEPKRPICAALRDNLELMLPNYWLLLTYPDIQKIFKMDFQEAQRYFHANGHRQTQWWYVNFFEPLLTEEKIIMLRMEYRTYLYMKNLVGFKTYNKYKKC